MSPRRLQRRLLLLKRLAPLAQSRHLHLARLQSRLQLGTTRGEATGDGRCFASLLPPTVCGGCTPRSSCPRPHSDRPPPISQPPAQAGSRSCRQCTHDADWATAPPTARAACCRGRGQRPAQSTRPARSTPAATRRPTTPCTDQPPYRQRRERAAVSLCSTPSPRPARREQPTHRAHWSLAAAQSTSRPLPEPRSANVASRSALMPACTQALQHTRKNGSGNSP